MLPEHDAAFDVTFHLSPEPTNPRPGEGPPDGRSRRTWYRFMGVVVVAASLAAGGCLLGWFEVMLRLAGHTQATLQSTLATWNHTGNKKPSDGLTPWGFFIGLVAVTAAIAVTWGFRIPKLAPRLTNLAIRFAPHKLAFWAVLAPVTGLILYSGLTLYAWSYPGGFNGYPYALGSVLVSAAATILVAFGGFFTFQTAFGFVTCRRLLKEQQKATSRQLREPEDAVQYKPPQAQRPIQAETVLQRLLAKKNVVLSAATIDAGNAFVKSLIEELSKKMVFLVIDGRIASGGYAHEIEVRFKARLQQLGVSPHPFLRSAEAYARALENLVAVGRLVVIVKNMDAAGYIDGPEAARKAVDQGITELVNAGILFATIVQPTAVPLNRTNESIAITPPNDLELHLSDTGIGLNTQQELKMERAIRRLAVALGPTGIRVETILDPVLKTRDTPPLDLDKAIATITATTNDLTEKGVVRFGCDLVRDRLEKTPSTTSNGVPLERAVLRAHVDRLVMTGGLTVSEPELYRDLACDHHPGREVSRAIHNLVKAEYLTDEMSHEDRSLGFWDARVGEIAVGWSLGVRGEAFQHSARLTALCVSAELYTRLRRASTAPFDTYRSNPFADPNDPLRERLSEQDTAEIWRHAFSAIEAGDREQTALKLEAIGGAISAVANDTFREDFKDGEFDRLLGDCWTNAEFDARRDFVERLTPRAVCRLSKFLWDRATAGSDGIASMHALDRSICRKLGSSGGANWYDATVWSTLETQWRNKIKHARTLTVADSADAVNPPCQAPPNADGQLPDSLYWTKKWPEQAFDPQQWATSHSLSLLGWTLPSLVVSTPEGTPPRTDLISLLADLEAVVTQKTWTDGSRPSLDVGMQIALAEGCRDACYLGLTNGSSIPPIITTVIDNLLAPPGQGERPALSWYARLVALQALLIATAAGSDADGEAGADHTPEQGPGNRRKLDQILKDCQHKNEHPLVRRYAALLIRARRKHPLRGPHQTVSELTWLDDHKAVSEAGGQLVAEAVLILAAATCVLNFSGASELLDNIGHRDQLLTKRGRGQDRIDGLKASHELPQFFTHSLRRKHASNALKPGTYDMPVRRQLSPTFIDRCLQLTKPGAQVKRSLAAIHDQGFPTRGMYSRVWNQWAQNYVLKRHLEQMARTEPATLRDAIEHSIPDQIQRYQWCMVRKDKGNNATLQLFGVTECQYLKLQQNLENHHIKYRREDPQPVNTS